MQRWQLPDGARRALLALVELVSQTDWAPTTVRDPQRVVDDHLADSLVALDLGAVRGATRIVDLGAGAGFPGLPLAVALVGAEVSLLESSSRKCAFLETALCVTEVTNATVVHSRAEEWEEGMGRHDLVTARAVGPLAVVAEYAAPLLALGGVLVAWRGRREPLSEQQAASAASQLGLEPAEPRLVAPYPAAQHRHLHIMSKVSETPPRFPRRAGIALKRPLGRAPEAPQ